MSEAYSRAWRDSIDRPEHFWSQAARSVEWISPPTRAFDEAQGWYPDASLNTCANCVDRHVAAGRGEATALIYDSPVTGTVRTYSYAELLEKNPTRAVEKAVKGMLPKNKLAAQQLSKLKVYAGAEHPHQAQQPKPYEFTQVAQ